MHAASVSPATTAGDEAREESAVNPGVLNRNDCGVQSFDAALDVECLRMVLCLERLYAAGDGSPELLHVVLLTETSRRIGCSTMHW